MSQRCSSCRITRSTTLGKGVLSDAPLYYCIQCLENNAESFDLFTWYIKINVNHISDEVRGLTIYYKGKYISYTTALEKMLLHSKL